MIGLNEANSVNGTQPPPRRLNGRGAARLRHRLLFGRDASELGRLGHPDRLEAPSGGGTPSGAAEARDP